MSTVSILSTSSFLWRSWAGQRITRSQWIHGANGSFICSWIQGLIVKWRMILLVRQRFKIFPSEEYMAHFSHRRSGGNSQLRSKVGRNPERQRRLVWFLTRSVTWARVIWISYRLLSARIRYLLSSANTSTNRQIRQWKLQLHTRPTNRTSQATYAYK